MCQETFNVGEIQLSFKHLERSASLMEESIHDWKHFLTEKETEIAKKKIAEALTQATQLRKTLREIQQNIHDEHAMQEAVVTVKEY